MSENSPEVLPVPPRGRKRGFGFKALFVLLIILAMGGVIVYLLSLINSKRFILVPEGNELVVKKGLFFLAGEERYLPTDPALAKVYAPLELPPEFHNAGPREFDDLASLNAALADILIKQGDKLLYDLDEAQYKKGLGYLGRLTELNGLTQKQSEDIHNLRAVVQYIEAKQAYLGVEKTLEDALAKFTEAERFRNNIRFKDAGEWIRKVNLLLESIRAAKSGTLPAGAKEREMAPLPGEVPAPAPEPEVAPPPTPVPPPAASTPATP